jgi:excisionase family DNA binding protein
MEESINKVLEKLEIIESNLVNTKAVLNLEEVCQLTGISKSTMYKLTSTREIPHYKKVKHLIFDRLEIEEWMKSNPIPTKEQTSQRASTFVTLNGRRR